MFVADLIKYLMTCKLDLNLHLNFLNYHQKISFYLIKNKFYFTEILLCYLNISF